MHSSWQVYARTLRVLDSGEAYEAAEGPQQRKVSRIC